MFGEMRTSGVSVPYRVLPLFSPWNVLLTITLNAVIVDLHTELPTRSGYDLLSSFSQPDVESLLEKEVLDRKIPLLRGYGESSPSILPTTTGMG